MKKLYTVEHRSRLSNFMKAAAIDVRVSDELKLVVSQMRDKKKED